MDKIKLYCVYLIQFIPYGQSSFLQRTFINITPQKHSSTVTSALGFQEVDVVLTIFHNSVKTVSTEGNIQTLWRTPNHIIAKLTFSKYSIRYKIWISLDNMTKSL